MVVSAHSPGDASANLRRIRPDGSDVWRAQPPDGHQDHWTQADLNGDVVSAFSWSCYRVRLDLTTGSELDRVFTK